jgi:hypothetical protein
MIITVGMLIYNTNITYLHTLNTSKEQNSTIQENIDLVQNVHTVHKSYTIYIYVLVECYQCRVQTQSCSAPLSDNLWWMFTEHVHFQCVYTSKHSSTEIALGLTPVCAPMVRQGSTITEWFTTGFTAEFSSRMGSEIFRPLCILQYPHWL